MADPATFTAAKSFFNEGSSSRPPETSSSKSYAAMVEKTLVCHLYNIGPFLCPISHQGEPGVCFTYDEIHRSVDPLRFSLIAKFSSGRPSVDEIRPHVRTHWMMNSEVHIGLLDPRHVILRFSSQEDFIQAWTRASLRLFISTLVSLVWSAVWIFYCTALDLSPKPSPEFIQSRLP